MADFVERATLPAAVVGPDHRLTAANELLAGVLGHPRDVLDGAVLDGLVHPDDLAAARDAVAAAVGAIAPGRWPIEARLACAVGGWTQVRLAILSFGDVAGALQALLVAEPVEPLRVGSTRRAALIESLLEHNPDLVQVVDRDGRHIFAAGGSQLIGRPAASLTGAPLFDLLPRSYRESARRWFADVCSRPGGHEPKVVRFDIAGAARYVEVRAANLLGSEFDAIVIVTRDVTDARRGQLTAQRHERILRQTPVAVLGVDRRGAVTMWNAAGEAMLGWKQDELVGADALALGLHTASSRRELQTAYPTIVRGRAVEFFADLTARDGDVVPVFVVASGLVDEQGEFDGVLFQALDMRDATGARAALARNEARLAALSREAREVVFVVDDHGRIVSAGEGVRLTLGYDAAGLVGTSLSDLAHPADAAVSASPVAMMGERRDSAHGSCELRLRHADGGWRVFEATVTDLRNQPAIDGYVVYGRDVTDRFRAQADLRRIAAAIETTGVAFGTTDVSGRTLTMNEAAGALVGLSPEETRHPRPGMASPLSAGEQASEVMTRALAGETVTWMAEMRHRDGRELSVLTVTSPILDAGGDVVGLSYLAVDQTNEVRATSELRMLAEQHATLADISTSALAATDIDELLGEACRRLAAVFGVDHAHVMLLGDDRSELVLRAAVGRLSEQVGTLSVPLAHARWASSGDKPARVLTIDDRAVSGADALPMFELPGARSVVACALEGPSGPIGVVAAYGEQPRRWSSSDRDFIMSAAGVLGTAIERAQAAQRLRWRVLHDDLTGLPNRTLLVDRLTLALARVGRRRSGVGVLFVDLDRFKRVNDTLGHAVGDEVLIEAANRLVAAARPGDTVARLGGDEFVVLCEDVADISAAEEIGRRFVRALGEPLVVGGHELVVTASVGVTIAMPAQASSIDAERLIHDSDLAMYRAKQTGRARVAHFDLAMRELARSSLEREEAVREAVRDRLVTVVYQPQIDLRSGEVVGVEALVRADHPRLDGVPVLQFIALADELGLVDLVADQVLDAACSTLARARRITPGLGVSVNVTARQLASPWLLDRACAVCATYGLPMSALSLEVTETELLDEDKAMSGLLALQRLGVRVSVDDFGTGYSSLSRLTSLQVDEVKIDRSFVANLHSDRVAVAVVAMAVSLGEALGIRVVAEGVETDEQRRRLAGLRCDFGQGYLWTPPLPAQAFIDWLRRA